MSSCKGKVKDEEEKEAKQEARDVVVRSCRPRRKRGIIVIIIVVVVVVMRVDVPSASSGDALGRRQRQCFSKVPVWVWPTPLENDPPRNKKKKTRKMSKNSQNIPVYTAAQVLQRISLSLYREREKKEAEVHALGSSYVISFSLVSPLLFLPFQSFLSFLSATILLLV